MATERATYSVYLPLWGVRRELYDWLNGLERVVASLSSQVLPVRSSPGSKALLSVSIEAIPDEILSVVRSGVTMLNRMPVSSSVHMKFEYEIPSLKALEEQITSPAGDEFEHVDLWRSFIELDVRRETSVFMMALDLASPGSSFHGDYVLRGWNGLQLHNVRSVHLDDDYQHVAENGLGRRDDLDFPVVWRRLNATNGLRWGVPDTPFAKVVSAITYLYAGAGGAVRFSDLVWACYGLEGFYGAGHESRGRQVEEKSAVFLGLDPQCVRKLIKPLYDLRSKFMHGNSPASSAWVEVQPPDGKISTDEWDAQHVAAYFLFETARECIRRDIRNQEFGLVLK
jgi:hypothetical protein